MLPSEISRRKIRDHYFKCSNAHVWQDASYKVALEDCCGEFIGTSTREPIKMCMRCGETGQEITKEGYDNERKSIRS